MSLYEEVKFLLSKLFDLVQKVVKWWEINAVESTNKVMAVYWSIFNKKNLFDAKLPL